MKTYICKLCGEEIKPYATPNIIVKEKLCIQCYLIKYHGATRYHGAIEKEGKIKCLLKKYATITDKAEGKDES